MHTVIKNWHFNPLAISKEPSVQIYGRSSGILAWMLSLMKIEPTVSLKVEGNKILFEQGSFGGYLKTSTPLSGITSVVVGYKKPWLSALSLALVLGACTYFIAGIGAIVGIIYYFLNKQLTIGYVTNTGKNYEIVFKPFVINGQKINETSASEVCDYICSLIAQEQKQEIKNLRAA